MSDRVPVKPKAEPKKQAAEVQSELKSEVQPGVLDSAGGLLSLQVGLILIR